MPPSLYFRGTPHHLRLHYRLSPQLHPPFPLLLTLFQTLLLPLKIKHDSEGYCRRFCCLFLGLSLWGLVHGRSSEDKTRNVVTEASLASSAWATYVDFSGLYGNQESTTLRVKLCLVKIKMLEYRRGRLEMEPVQLNAISPANDSNILEFRRVVCRGVFDEKKSIFVGPRSRSISGVTENGYYLITPLLPIPGDPESVQSPVLVNRGWVPRSWRDRALQSLQDVEEAADVHSPTSLHVEKHSFWRFWSKKREKSEEQGSPISLVEVIGVVRGSEKPSIFVPENDPNSAQWFYVDVPGIARAAGLPENVTYIEDVNENVNPSNPYPIPKDANSLIRSSVMPQDHLNYTLTWYSLSAAVTFMAYKRLQPRSRRR